jgi:thymidylate kinase
MIPHKIKRQFIKPITFLCWANIETTIERLIKRNDKLENEWDNQKFVNLYYKIAKKNNLTIIDTSYSPNPVDIVNKIAEIIANGDMSSVPEVGVITG